MGQPLEFHIRKLQEFYWSDEDPDGRGFVPLADALRKAGDLWEAHRLLREGIARHPDFLSAHLVSAWTWLDRGRKEDAEASFRTVLELDPKNIFALRGLSGILLDREEIGPALALLETLSHEDPMDGDLPGRILEIRKRESALEASGPDEDSDAESPIWEDSEGVAEELNLEDATLQADSSGIVSTAEDQEVSSPEAGVEEEDEPVPVSEGEGLDAGVEDGEPIPEQEDLDGALVTSTLGEIYLRQGLLERARSVFETLLESDPENEHLRHRLEEVRELLRGGGDGQDDGTGELEEAWAEEEEDLPAVVVPIEDLAPEDASFERAQPPLDVVPIESLAPDRVGKTATREPEAEPPGAVPVEALAPGEPIPVHELAPHEPFLQPHPGHAEPVPIWALAPDDPVAIESLAPDGPVAIESLAPGPSAPAVSEDLKTEDDPGGDTTIQSFEAWLEKLQ